VLISEIGLSEKHMHVSLDLARLNGGSLLVISDNHAPSHFKDHFDLDVERCIGTSVKSVFRDIQAIYVSQKPRAVRDQRLCRSNY
jgi:hypothetical protein